MDELEQQLQNLRKAFESGALDEDTYRAAVAGLTAQTSHTANVSGSGGSAQSGGIAAGEEGVAAGQIAGHVVVAKEGATVVIGDAPVPMTAVDRESALGKYLQHVVSRNRYLQLQGIRSGGRLVHIELDRIYIKLRATRQRVVTPDDDWLAREAALARRTQPPRDTSNHHGDRHGRR
ncbi:MAG: hypothetical protein R2844_18155 [Caldilineales bacterium]